jgi:predicted nucleic acid-binding protein
MIYVLDSSVAFKWVVWEVDSDKAIRLRDDFWAGYHSLMAPDVFPVEAAHALTRAERQGRIVVSQAGVLLADVWSTGLTLHSSLTLLTRACEISSFLRIGV